MGSTPSRDQSTTSSKAGSRPGSGASSKSSKKGGMKRSNSGVQFGVQGAMSHKALSSVAAAKQKDPSTLGSKLPRESSVKVGKHVSPAVRLWLPSLLRRSQLDGKDYDVLLKRILHDELELTWDECKPVLEKITHINQVFAAVPHSACAIHTGC
eukprot:2300527-Rhodomonas_salina.3